MNPLDALWHLLNLLAPALGVSLLASTVTKLLWWRALQGVAWWRLATWCAASGSAGLLACLMYLGHDGKAASYAVMVLACTVTLWWLVPRQA
jgi:hypothetical protein